jgi:hypothetical protein
VRVGFVACCGRKLPHIAPAKDIYQSDLFKKSRAWVEANCDEWYILSALYGIVHPDTEIAPYDVTLNEMPKEDRDLWASKVRGELHGLGLEGEELVVLAGKRYRDPFLLVPHECPMEGLGIGQQLAWLMRQTGDALQPGLV